MQEKSDIKVNIFWNTFGSIFYCLCQWVITVLVVRIDSFEASGQLSLAMTTSSSFSAIALFSMRNYQMSDVDEQYKTMHYVGSRVVTCLISFVLCMGYSVMTGVSTYQLLCIAFFMVIRLVEATVDVLHGINQKYERYDLIGKSFVIRGIVSVVVFSICLFIFHDMMLTLAIMAIGNVLVALFYDLKNTARFESLKPVIKDKQVYMLLVTCVPLVIFSFFLSLENLIPKTFLQELYGDEALGIYSSLASPTLVVQVGASVVFGPLLPTFTRVFNSGEYVQFRKMFHKVLLVMVFMCLFVSGAAYIVGEFGLRILYGEVILEYYELFMPIVWSTILMACVWVMQSITIGIRQIYPMLVGILVDFMICYLTCKWFLTTYSWNGASLVQIVCLAILVVYMIIVCEVTIFMRSRKQKKEVGVQGE